MTEKQLQVINEMLQGANKMHRASFAADTLHKIADANDPPEVRKEKIAAAAATLRAHSPLSHLLEGLPPGTRITIETPSAPAPPPPAQPDI